MSSDNCGATGERSPWARSARRALDSYVAANEAIFTAMGFPASSSSGRSKRQERDAEEPPVVELSFGDEAWTMVRSTDEREELGVGDYVRFCKPITDEDVSAFAQVSGDTNRLHLDDEFADETRFSGRIAHGTLVAGTISAALARLPGATVYLSQDLEFRGPVEIGTTVTAECEIAESLGDDQYRVLTTVYDEDEEIVIDGEAVVLISELPDT